MMKNWQNITMINDTYIIQGLSEIVNNENVRQDVITREVEQQLIKGGLMPKQSKLDNSISEKFTDELRAEVHKLGIPFDEYFSGVAPKQQSAPENYAPQQKSYRMDPFEDTTSNDANDNADTEFDARTKEEERKNHINNVLGATSSQSFSLEQEREEDDKCTMLAEIDYLIDSLTGDGINISRIPKVTESDDIKTIENVMKILRKKVDHSRYCTFAEEFMLAGAHGIEYLFDGKNLWFNRWKPDLTGWHVHVNSKFKRMRVDTGKVVSHVMNDYDIGAFMRICLELIPNALLYSKGRSEQNTISNLNLDNNLDSTMKSARNI